MNAVTVYCASSIDLKPDFHEVAAAVGRELAARELALVYGGGSVGLMGETARAARSNGGTTIGIITETLMSRELGDKACDELIVVPTMRERKRLLLDRGDAILVLPGGIGTYEEFFEVLVGRKLGEHDKPIGIVNSHGYYNPLIAMIEHGVEHNFIHADNADLFTIDPDPIAVLDAIVGQPVASS